MGLRTFKVKKYRNRMKAPLSREKIKILTV